MAFLEWRKFQFFKLNLNQEGSLKFADLSQECTITSTSAGNNHLVFGDSSGQIHLVSRSWSITSFRAYDNSVDHMFQLRNSPLLITIGHDEAGINPLIKVWDTSKFDKNITPYCPRITKASMGPYGIAKVSCLTVHENQQLMAIGFADGSVLLFRGDVSRERSSKQKVFKDLKAEVTGLAFKVSANSIFLYVSTHKEVVVYNITHKDKEQKFNLDTLGCSTNCSVLSESMQETQFMIARKDAIYCYTPDGRGPCYAMEGEKIMLEWFKNYLIIITKTSRPSTFANTEQINQIQEDLIIILDIHNKFIVYQSAMSNIQAVLYEWGSFFVITHDSKIYLLDEKDLQSKLSLLFKKNLYDVAIRIAKSQQYHLDGLVDIFKQYGDHLCEKGDHAGAIEQYTKTIGKLEPSYVIRKFVDSQHLEKLIIYLQALHKQGQATEDHTTLLLNCYTKLNNTVDQTASLREFILAKETELNFDDVEVAIKGNLGEALRLAEKHKKHDWYIKIQIEDHQNYMKVLEYIGTLGIRNAEYYMKQYGQVLIKHLPTESTEFLKRLCTNYRPDNLIIEDNSITGNYEITEKSDPEEFIHLFLNNSRGLVDLLEHLIGQGSVLSSSVYNNLLEHYLLIWSATEGINEKQKLGQRIVELLQNPDIKLDKSHALVVCDMHSFSDGILYIYEEQKLYQQILRYHISKNDSNSVLACCTRFGHQDPSLWVQALWSSVRDTKQPSMDLLNEILTVIAKEKLFSPQLAIDAVSTGNAEITLGHIRLYVTNELQQEMKQTNEMAKLTKKYRKDTDIVKQDLNRLKNGVTRIQGARCAICRAPLELPTIHFTCEHSFHQHCFQTCTDDSAECPTCQPVNKDMLELIKAREQNKDLHEIFHYQLDKAHDGFSVAAEYFGRGVFNNYNLLGSVDIFRKPVLQVEKKPIKYETVPKPIEIGRTRPDFVESKRPTKESKSIVRSDKLSQSHGKVVTKSPPTSKNPFEDGDEDYDDSLNPFQDTEEELDKTNPFREDYNNCDKNLNPFD